jgi:alcohol dehydrogenase (cytochrome c)
MADIGRSTRCVAGAMGMVCAGLLATAVRAQGIADSHWPAYNNTANGQRYSPLEQINTANVSQLKEICRIKVDDSGTFQAGLVELDGTLYLSNAHDTLAIDARSCVLRWRHVYHPQEQDVFQINRGVAYANGKLFRGTPDARLLAIDAASGKTLWQQQVGDPGQGEFFSSVPAIWQGTLIIGAAGSDWGIRGRVMAYDQLSGHELWRFNTIPRGKELGAETWQAADSARYGGGGSWTTYTLDMAAGEVFVPVGNPAPDFVPSHRPGKNLFTNSMVVLDARTGALKWWHQMESNDGLDLDLGAAPMLYWNSKGDAMVAFGSKDGHLYAVNRETHKRVFKTAVTTIEKPTKAPTADGVHTCPGPVGGVEWNGPAFDAKTRQLVVGAVDWCAVIKSDKVDFQPGKFLVAGSWIWDDKRSGWISAVDPDSGALRWQYHAEAPVVAGLTPTAGGVTFGGDMGGNFIALDSKTGALLHKVATGGAVAGGIITYALGGRQYVAIDSGNVSRLSFGENGKPSVVIYALDEGGSHTASVAAPAQAVGQAPLTAADVAHGRELFGHNCAACHGAQGEGGAGPRLTDVRQRLDHAATVRWIENPSAKMPRLFPSTLNAQDVLDVAAFVQTL